MKIIYNNLIPFKGFKAINLFGFLFIRNSARVNVYDINHEDIHTRQMKELLYIPFYIWYFIEWLVLFFKYKDSHKAYKNIRFEKEAYEHEKDLGYVYLREHYNYI